MRIKTGKLFTAILIVLFLLPVQNLFAYSPLGGNFVRATERQMVMSTNKANKKVLYEHPNLTVELYYTSLMKENKYKNNQENPYIVISNKFYKECFSTSFSCQGFIRSASVQYSKNMYLIFVDFQTNQNSSSGGFTHEQTGIFIYDRQGINYIGSYTREFQGSKEYGIGKGQLVDNRYFAVVEYKSVNGLDEFNTKIYDLLAQGECSSGVIKVNNYTYENFKIEYVDQVYIVNVDSIPLKNEAKAGSRNLLLLNQGQKVVVNQMLEKLPVPDIVNEEVGFWIPVKVDYVRTGKEKSIGGWVWFKHLVEEDTAAE